MRSFALLAALGVLALVLILLPGRKQELPADFVGHTEAWTIVGHAGLELGGFNQPRGITTLPDGGFMVADRSARIQRFDAQGHAVALWEMKERKLGNPKGLGCLPNGHLLICDTHYARLLETTLGGEIVKHWGGPGLAPGQFGLPQACAIDAKRNAVYVVDYGGLTNNRVDKFDLKGQFLLAWGEFGENPGQFRRASGITLDADGHVYVADASNHRIQKFDPQGKVLGVFGELGGEPGQLKYPYDIAYGPDRKLYIAEFGNHRISVFDISGRFLETMGQPGARKPGQFYAPWNLTVDPFGRLLVSDTANHRIQIRKVCEPAGEYARVAGK